MNRKLEDEPAGSPVSWMKRQDVRGHVLAGAKYAMKQRLPPLARTTLESQRANFIKAFDAIEENAQDEIFAAIELAFHIGRRAQSLLALKEVPRASIRHAQAQNRKNTAPRTAKIREVVREAMSKKPAKHRRGLQYARRLEHEVNEAMGRKYSADQIRNYAREIDDSERQKSGDQTGKSVSCIVRLIG
jgi:hypothetical protein